MVRLWANVVLATQSFLLYWFVSLKGIDGTESTLGKIANTLYYKFSFPANLPESEGKDRFMRRFIPGFFFK